MKSEKIVFIIFSATIAVAFGTAVFTAPQPENKVLAGLFSGVFVFLSIIIIKHKVE